jgi:flagellar biosynthesis/type III secretory pathway M-ring protein FliF/YscJ
VLPVVIFVAVAIPLLVIGFVAVRRRTAQGEHPSTETEADRERTEHEYDEAEQYQEEWREQNHEQLREERLP